ncbi:hypothetical protein IWQ60_004252 [Tieghemiomyces parasiticus]|uniref:DM2 domain-containing protein n=1 Tax=Tieghemiomyces parasiticus TaxID=78921 RepID=A0A9W8DZI4_9FUNG|nr:hypothetical protein IWQ60_004252 [Tieghemiomyces parasiticus]
MSLNVNQFEGRIFEILRASDPESISARKVRKQLQQEKGIDLSAVKDKVDDLILKCYEVIQQPPVTSPPAPTTLPALATPASATNVHVASVLPTQPAAVSHSLHLESLFDDSLTPGSDSSVSSLPLSPGSSATSGKKRTFSELGMSTKPPKKKVEKDPPKAAKGKASAKKTKKPKNPDPYATKIKAPNNNFNKTMNVSPTLASIIKVDQASRPQMVKLLWIYIKANDLQDSSDRRFILCDDKLKELFHTNRISMFGMNKLLGAHLSDIEGGEPTEKAGENSDAPVAGTEEPTEPAQQEIATQ